MNPLAVIQGASNAADQGLSFVGHTKGIAIGYTQPSGIYQRMQVIQTDALRLDANIRSFVSSQPFVQAWRAWLESWTPLYERYAGPHASTSAKALAAFRTDEFSDLVNEHQAQLANFLASYNAQRQPNGEPVPQLLLSPQPVTPPKAAFSLPWWFWMLGGAAVIGLGYVGYRKYHEGKAKAAVVKKHAPKLLEHFLGPDGGKAAYEYSQAGRDPDSNEVEKDPFSLEHYARKAPPNYYDDSFVERDMPHSGYHGPIRNRSELLDRYSETEHVLHGRDHD